MRQEQSRPFAPDDDLRPHAAAEATVDSMVDLPAATRVSTAGTPRVRNNFDGVRLLGALLVTCGHLTIDRTGTDGLRLVMFFSISGFLVTGSWTSDPHLGRFVARRFLRIWPAYAALIVGCAALSWAFPARDMPDISRMASLFYLRNLWAPGFDWGFFPAQYPMMNRSLWMLPFEVDIYVVFAFVALLGRPARIVVATLFLLLALRAPPTTAVSAGSGLLESWSLYFSGFFAFGVLMRELPQLRANAVIASCVIGGTALMWFGERTAGLLLVIPPGAVWIGLRSWPVVRSAARFGDLSFGIFLWSFPVQQVTRLWLAADLPLIVQCAVVLLQVVPIAWLSCRFVEVPALRLKPRRPASSRRVVGDATSLSMPGLGAKAEALRHLLIRSGS